MIPPENFLEWPQTFRIIPSRYPPIQLFERIGEPGEWEALAAIESLTNPRVRQDLGEISLVPLEERVSGPGASWIMSAFTHLGRASRFSPGSFGVYYTAKSRPTAICETSYHMGRFYGATKEPATQVDMRVLISGVQAAVHDLRGGHRRFAKYYLPNDYSHSQHLGESLHKKSSAGIVYESVRHEGGECLAAFRPRILNPPVQGPHLVYRWNGQSVDHYFDPRKHAWIFIENRRN